MAPRTVEDELDDRVRAAMKTLDDDAPSGYWESLPDRVLQRLGVEETMQANQPTGTSSNREPGQAAPPNEEDSGLHDIRSLAQSTKQRISNKKITLPPTNQANDDDVLASSSASWKNLALPQPAAMVSLPELDELPSKQEVKKQQKLAAKATGPNAVLTQAEISSASSTAAAVDFKPAFSSVQKQPATKASSGRNRNRNIALVGMGLAAAAGGVFFVMSSKKDAAPVVEQTASAPAAQKPQGNLSAANDRLDQVTQQMNAEHARAEEAANAAPAPAAEATGGEGAPAPVVAATPPADVPTKAALAKPAVSKHAPGEKKSMGKADDSATPLETPAPKKGKADGGAADKGDGEDKDFNALLKEAGVNEKKEAKPKLDKKELTSDDFKHGMQAIQAKAAACYKGTQGSANVKLTVAPSGAVSKVTVSGVFAGKPEADCVAAAVKSASFPAWDGAPQSFGYPILLSE